MNENDPTRRLIVVDTNSPRVPLTVQLPAELTGELQALAREMELSLDEVVMEACLAFTEPHYWSKCYEDWRQS